MMEPGFHLEDDMTEAEAQAWLQKTFIVFISDDDGQQWIGIKDVEKCVHAPDFRGAHYVTDSEFQEELTLQQIVDIANGG